MKVIGKDGAYHEIKVTFIQYMDTRKWGTVTVKAVIGDCNISSAPVDVAEISTSPMDQGERVMQALRDTAKDAIDQWLVYREMGVA